MLHNPIYAGEIAHKGKVYPGQHERIIAPDLWEAVQKRLNTNTRERRVPANITGTFILTGKLFDETGDRLSPTSANRNGKRHRYYVSAPPGTGDRSNGGWRLPARQLEQVVIDGVVALLNDPIRLSRELPVSRRHPAVAGAPPNGIGDRRTRPDRRNAAALLSSAANHPHRALESRATGCWHD